MSLVIYNTITRTKEEFVPREPGVVSMYVCGPTVYNHIHVGNARAFIVFDVMRRYLRWRGLRVRFVQNYTDVDDKIIERAGEESLEVDEVTRKYSDAFEDVMNALGVAPPNVLVRATDHIPEMIEMISMLVERGFAYESEGNVWFAVEKFPEYGKLSGRSLDDVRAGERVEPDPSKRFPLDFALWKAAKAGEPAWKSPWGTGRPGWHIECSAMSLKYLGMGFDIHGGGTDLIFPHHENEIAQSEAATGESPFVRYWIHNGMVNIDEQKMSKSLGNFVLAKDLVAEVPSQVIRLMAIAGHYRSDIDFGDAQFEDAKKAFERFEIFYRNAKDRVKGGGREELSREFLARFQRAMDDDFNTPEALSVLHDLVRQGNARMAQPDYWEDAAAVEDLHGMLEEFVLITELLGVRPREEPAASADLTEGLVALALSMRESARSAGRFDEADAIRSSLNELGIAIEDSPEGPRWRRII